MQCLEDITLFNSFIQRQRLYQFLAGVNDSLDKEKRDLLNHDPLPSIDAAYAFIRREIARRGIMTDVSSSRQNPSEIGSGLVANRRSESSFRREDTTHLKCTHCGGTKHTKKGCFEIIGYPEWWEEYTKKKATTKAGAGGKASVAVYSNPESTGSGNISDNISGNTGISGMREEENVTDKNGGKESREQSMESEIQKIESEDERRKEDEILLHMSARRSEEREENLAHKTHSLNLPLTGPICLEAQTENLQPNDLSPKPLGFVSNKIIPWIFDCGATDTMTSDPSDIKATQTSHRNQIQTANGEYIPVTKTGIIDVTLDIHLNNCLLIPSLTHKLLSDALTGRIIGRGTERGGLYYVDEEAQQGNALLAHGSPESQLWMWHRRLEAIATSTYLTNRLPSKPLDYQTPLDTLSSHVTIPLVHSLPPRVFGCVVYVHLPKRARNKLEPRAIKCVFIGYGVYQKGYRCYDPIQKRVYTTLDCEFFEQTYYYTQLGPQGENLSGDLSWLTYPKMVDPDPTTQVGNTTDATPEAVVPLPLQSPPDPPNEHPSDDIPSSEEVPSESSPVSYNIPEINPVSNESEQNRYELPPRSTRGVPPRRYDPEYEDQRSRYPIERISTENLSSTDIAFNASLYSADIPKNVEEAVKNEKWKQAMEEEQINSNHTLFLKKEKEKITCLIIYVDDMIITGNDEEEIADLKGKLFQEFEMKDLGNLKYFLGIEVLRSKQGIFIHQRKYILDLLAETGMLGCKPAETPIVANHGLQILEGAKLTNKEQYQKIVGKLIYLAHTRPDIAYAVGVVSRFMHLPQVQHMTAVMRILRYLKGTSSTGIYFDKNDHLDLIAYTDAD
uniref:Reverse transcriptase Ty1/copia-type domain-containing protein n=1 Tax=Chenopodium quinoa TaxID=63459 RepID=A0A803NB30_CHEQI